MANGTTSQPHHPPPKVKAVASSAAVAAVAAMPPPPRAKPLLSLTRDLHEELLAHVLRFLAPRDVEAITVASKRIAQEILTRFSIWKLLFCYRWQMLNFALDGRSDGSVAMEIDDRLSDLFPRGCTESRMYQLLAHAATPVPSFADIRQTERTSSFSAASHGITAIGNPQRRQTRDVAFAGRHLGGDRCVRSNVPFTTTFRVAVYATGTRSQQQEQPQSYRVSVVASGYFEITIRERALPASKQQAWRHFGTNMTSLGLAAPSFELVDSQPGWDGYSIGYHGDDGHLFNRHNRGRAFGVPFGVGDTVGCGVRRDVQALRSFIYFTNNGDLIPSGDQQIECIHGSWFPVVGLDSLDIIHFNFGQEPFACAEAVDALMSECEGQTNLLSSQLQWYDICESDAESSSSDSDGESDSDSDEAYHDDDMEDDMDDDMEDDDLDRLEAMHAFAQLVDDLTGYVDMEDEEEEEEEGEEEAS